MFSTSMQKLLGLEAIRAPLQQVFGLQTTQDGLLPPPAWRGRLHGVLGFRAGAERSALGANDGEMKGMDANGLPPQVRDLARRLGATDDANLSMVTLTQRGVMHCGPMAREMQFRSKQTIDLWRPDFEWRASTGPLGCISIHDAIRGGEADLTVRAFGFLRIASLRGGDAAAKGEVMRYVAELAWAPDAILRNSTLTWTVVDARTLRVGARQGRTYGEVELQLDEDGRIGRVSAEDRPRQEGAGFVERPWRGRFFDYREHQGRWLPFGGEVGWVLDGRTSLVWRGTLLNWRVV